MPRGSTFDNTTKRDTSLQSNSYYDGKYGKQVSRSVSKVRENFEHVKGTGYIIKTKKYSVTEPFNKFI